MAKSPSLQIVKNCDYCPSTLPTVRIRSGAGLTSALCRACALDILRAIEEPSEYPIVLAHRDDDLDAIREANK